MVGKGRLSGTTSYGRPFNVDQPSSGAGPRLRARTRQMEEHGFETSDAVGSLELQVRGLSRTPTTNSENEHPRDISPVSGSKRDRLS